MLYTHNLSFENYEWLTIIVHLLNTHISTANRVLKMFLLIKDITNFHYALISTNAIFLEMCLRLKLLV